MLKGASSCHRQVIGLVVVEIVAQLTTVFEGTVIEGALFPEEL